MVRAAIPQVDPHEFHSLNERFYRLAPYEYLDARLQSLILTVSDDAQDELGRLLARGVSYKNVKATGEPASRTTLDSYAAVESTVLLHHAAEALLRLYIAHSHRERCPWLALSSILGPAQFKTEVRTLRDELGNTERVDDLLEVFSFSPDRSRFAGVTEDAWSSHRDGLVLLIRHLIDEVLNGAHAYNAAKHGLALGAGDLGLSLIPEGEEALFDHKGPALNYLELGGKSDDRHWLLTSTFLSPPRNIAVITLTLSQIQSMWTVGKTVRHVDPPESPTFNPLSLETVKAVLEVDQEMGFTPQGFSERLHAAPE
jgi:hypothetical protein